MYKKSLPKTWKQLNDLLQNQCYERRRLRGRNSSTFLVRVDDKKILLQFHNTTIATITTNEITVHECEQKTKSAKIRINWILPCGVSIIQIANQWFLQNATSDTELDQDTNIAWNGDIISRPIK